MSLIYKRLLSFVPLGLFKCRDWVRYILLNKIKIKEGVCFCE